MNFCVGQLYSFCVLHSRAEEFQIPRRSPRFVLRTPSKATVAVFRSVWTTFAPYPSPAVAAGVVPQTSDLTFRTPRLELRPLAIRGGGGRRSNECRWSEREGGETEELLLPPPPQVPVSRDSVQTSLKIHKQVFCSGAQVFVQEVQLQYNYKHAL